MSGRRRSTFQETEEEESLWENLEDIENIFEKELKDLKEISTSRGHNTNVEHENGSHFEEQESLIWNCGLCGSYYFKDHLHFSNHLLEHHSVEERKRQNQNFYGCLSCGNGFKDLDILESHLLVEELCHKDYDKALLALYKRHSVPRFFAPLYDRCKTCQDKFDKLYRLLQYFPRCGHSENNRPRKISSQSALTKSNSNGNSNQESSTNVICGRDKKNRKSFSNNSTKIMDSSQNENNLQSHMGSSDDSFLLDNDDDYFNGYFFIGTLSMNKSKISIDKYNYRRSEQEVDPLICMGKVKTKSTRTKKNNSNIFHGFQPTNTINDSNLVCHGFNGVKWIHSRSSNQIKNRIKGKKSSKRIKLNPALNLDGAYDEDSSSPTHGGIEIIEIDADDNGCHEDIQGVEGIIESSPCKQDSLSQPCIECKIDGFESRRAFLFHQVFLHERSYCPHCDLIFETSVDLFNHEKEVHTFFPCDNCKKEFSTYDGLIIHLRKHHDTYLCPFCNLIFSKDTIEGHFSNNHRLQVNQYTLNECIKIALSGIKIISKMNSLTATCSFCLKMKSLHKIYDHYRVWHNFTSLHLFKILAQSGFTLEPNSCNNNVQYHSSEFQNVGYFLDFDGKCSSQKYPLDSYDCPVKNCANKKRNDKDYGLHLLIHHNLKYCLACDTFFKIISDLNTYSHTNCAGNSFECSLCHSNFNDVFSLFQHRVQIHGLLTCILCKNLIFTHKESFYVHFRHSHNVHKSWYINLDISKQFDRSLVSISESKSRIKCNLCEKVELKLDQTGALRSHLSSIHGVEAYNILFASYDGFKDFKVSSISQKKNDNSSYESIQFEDTSDCIFITENDVNVIIEKTGNGQVMNELNDIPQKLPKSILEKDKSSYICSVCDEVFKSSLKLQSHVDEIHSQSGKNYRCDFCPTMTNSLESMKKHLLKIHKSSILMSEEYSLKCNYCSENFWSLGERHAHMNKKHPDSKIDGDFKCKICKHVSPNKNALRRHFQRMHPAEPLRSNVSYKCDICQILFQWKSQLHDHVKEKHKDQEENGCNVCKLKFKSVKALKNHEKSCSLISQKDHNKTRNPKIRNHENMNTTTSEMNDTSHLIEKSNSIVIEDHENVDVGEAKIRKLKCEFCNIILQTSNSREEHYRRVHNGLLPFTCGECNKGFSTKSSLVNHKIKHGNFVCSFCSKEFNRRDSFNEHQLIHTGPRYICPHCPKEFVQKSNLRRHIRIHLGIKPYKCKHCLKAFSDSAAQKAHESTHLSIKISCEVCGQKFARKQKLNYHMRIHTGDGLLVCELCKKVFTNSYSMKRHLLTHSENKNFACNVCLQVFSSKKNLSVHLRIKENLGKECKLCGLVFHSETELNAHLLGYHKEANGCSRKGYKCRHCDSSFNSLSDIRVHLLMKHNIDKDLTFHFINSFRNESENTLYQEPSTSQSFKYVQCLLCGGLIKNTEDFYVHLMTMHDVKCSKDGNNQRCPLCNLDIGSSPLDFNTHIRCSHPESMSPMVEEEKIENASHLNEEFLASHFLDTSIDESYVKNDSETL